MPLFSNTFTTDSMKFAIYFSLLFLFGACKSSQGVTDEETKLQPSTAVSEIFSGNQCNILEKKQVLITDNEAWTTFWASMQKSTGNLPEIPEIDWEENSVLAAFMGQQSSGGYSVKIEGITIVGQDANVSIVYVSPGKTCFVPMMLSQPFTIVKVKGVFKEIKPTFKDTIENCK